MVANKGNNEGLFRGAFMESGSPLPVGDITNGQPHFDAIASETGCSTAADKLECLRTVPYDNLTAAMNTSPGQFGYGVCCGVFTGGSESDEYTVPCSISLAPSSGWDFHHRESAGLDRCREGCCSAYD